MILDLYPPSAAGPVNDLQFWTRSSCFGHNLPVKCVFYVKVCQEVEVP